MINPDVLRLSGVGDGAGTAAFEFTSSGSANSCGTGSGVGIDFLSVGSLIELFSIGMIDVYLSTIRSPTR